MKILYNVFVWVISWTWGLVSNLIGLIGFLVFLKKPHYKYKGMFITQAQSSGGWAFTTGLFVFTTLTEAEYKTAIGGGSSHTKMADHELGHGLPQTLLFGPFQWLFFTIPSIIWFNYNKNHKWNLDYEWPYWESTASKWGSAWSKMIDKL